MKPAKELNTARDVMTREPVCVEPWMTMIQLARMLSEYEISGAPVVDNQGCVIGMVSKTDLIQRCLDGLEGTPPGFLFEMLAATGSASREMTAASEVRVEDFMSSDLVAVSPDTALTRIAALMSENRIHRVVVVDEKRKPIGIITSLDVLGAFPGAKSRSSPKSARLRSKT